MSPSPYSRLAHNLGQGLPSVVLGVKAAGEGTISRTCLDAKALEAEASQGISGEALELAREALASGGLLWRRGEDGSLLLAEPVLPQARLIVLGGGHISRPLVEFGARLGFEVTVCDDRPSFANPGRFPLASRVVCDYFGHFLEDLVLGPAAHVAIVTRGHKHDLECFRAIAERNLAYVGMIGSRRRIAGLRAQLLAEGLGQAWLDRLQAPIGLDIGAVTPEEIALSIMAQIVAARRKGGQGGKGPASSPTELDLEVLRDLAREEPERRAVVTVVSTKGSVPRGPGAKMIVYALGRIVGSIGGGCSEGEVVTLARDLIRSGGFLVHKIDMTGEVAEDEGMVCGGIMEVLIEA